MQPLGFQLRWMPGGSSMSDDVTGDDEAIIARALAIATIHRAPNEVPGRLIQTADPAPLALYIALKFLQSLPRDDELRAEEYGMKAVLCGRYSEFVGVALSSDPSPPDIELFSS